MKKLSENKFLYFIVMFITTSIVAMIIWPLFDFLVSKFITNSQFTYTIFDHIVKPTIFGAIFAAIDTIIISKKSEK